MHETPDLLDGLQKGDKATYEILFHKYYGSLSAFARRYLKNADDAEEAACQVLFQIWVNREKLEVNVSIKNYLIRSVHNYCLNAIRHRKVEQKFFEKYAGMNYVNVEEETPQNKVQRSEIENIIRDVVSELPAQCKKVFLMSREENLSHKEIAEKLNISVNTVKTQLARSSAKLKLALKDYLLLLI
jgi:RNA polymerase sigma-70 factor (ECF subfamily)